MFDKRLLYLIIALFLSTSLNSVAQVDSTYIREFTDDMAITAYMSKDFLILDHEEPPQSPKTFIPNNPINIGLGISINNTIINFGYSYGFEFTRDRNYGKTRSFDIQVHYYGRKFVLDVIFQRYRGFYDDNLKEKNFYYDLKVRKYGVHGHYVFNNRKYSYRAAFGQSEKQLKSAGSFLLGGGVYQTKITSDSSFLHKNSNTFNNFQFGVSAGYAHTFVIGSHWDISLSATAGINFGSKRPGTFGKQRLEVYPTIFPRFSVGYIRDSWSLGFFYLGNITFSSISDGTSLGIQSGSFQLTFIKRLNNVSFIKRKRDKRIKAESSNIIARF